MEELIEKNMGLVLAVVKRFNPRSAAEKDEYIQAGRIGLWKAITKYSPTGGSKFSPYAWNPIKWEIIKEIRAVQTGYESISIEDCPHLCATTSHAPFWELLPETLSHEELEVVSLRREGYNFKEIASKLACHRSRITKIFHDALNKIRETNGEE